MTSIERLTEANAVRHVLERARLEAEKQLAAMREIAKEIIPQDAQVIVGVNGSVARREVTSGSDVDLFFLTTGDDVAATHRVQETFRERLKAEGVKMPAHGGVFEKPLMVRDLLSNIGGDDDTNEFLTRRMLYLLEGEWLYNPESFNTLRGQLVSHYVRDELEDHKLCRYLLNDVIRYWRTICVDFEEKTADGGKPRAIRLIKLRFARMMLYFGGVAAIARTGDVPAQQKRALLLETFAKPPAKRLTDTFGEADMEQPIAAYATFLNAIDDTKIRDALERDGHEGLETEEYLELVAVARDFRQGLQNVLVGPDGLRGKIGSALLL
jgi:predicted nucleotidyltransferase